MGNITFNTEFNFYQDPEAACIVLQAGFKNVRLIPWETCLKAEPKGEQISRLYNDSTPLGQLHKQSNDHMLDANDGKYFIIDTLTAVSIIDESSILSSFEAIGCVDVSTGMSKGTLQLFTPKSCGYQKQLMTEKFGVDTSRMNLTVITEIDLHKAISLIA